MILFVGYFTYSYLNKERMEDLNLITQQKKTEEFNQKNDEKSEIQASNTILKLSKMNNIDYSKLCKNSFDYAKNNLSREINNKENLEIFSEYYV